MPLPSSQGGTRSVTAPHECDAIIMGHIFIQHAIHPPSQSAMYTPRWDDEWGNHTNTLQPLGGWTYQGSPGTEPERALPIDA